jgi:hypothetical protein
MVLVDLLKKVDEQWEPPFLKEQALHSLMHEDFCKDWVNASFLA